MALFRVVVLCSCLIVVSGQYDNCTQPIAHYVELGCKPSCLNKANGCPRLYDCSLLEQQQDQSKCYYKSKAYSVGETIGNSVIDAICSSECRCDNLFGPANFMCAFPECPDRERECVYQQEPKDCCQSRLTCDPAQIANLATCNYGGRTYREGERILIDSECKRCVCTKDFNGSQESLRCIKVNCGVELYDGPVARRRCAPVYLEGRKCCPIQWKCPGSGDQISRCGSNQGCDMKCLWGSAELNVGDEVKTDDRCLTCKCSIPPLVTCIRSAECP